MSETLKNGSLARSSQPAPAAVADAVRDPAIREFRPEHFLPAFERAFADHTAEIEAIANDPAAPDFANTITALERSGKLLSRVSAVFYDLVSADSSPALLEIDSEVSPRMARHWNPIMMNVALFARIARLHDNRDKLDLTSEQMRLLERSYTALPPRRRRARREGQAADGRDQRAACPPRNRVQPPSARGRAGLVHGTR